MRKIKVISLLSIACLAISGCAQRVTMQGEFCDVSMAIKLDQSAAAFLVEHDRKTAVQIDAHNRYGERVCGWKS